MSNTYILLSRSLLESEVFASQKLLKIWIWCLLKANYKDRFVTIKVGRGERTIKIKRGQFLFGRFKAEEELFIDGSTIYKIIKKLEQIGNISIKSSNQYSIVTINNYDTYQDPDTYKVTADEQPIDSKGTAKEQPSNTNNKDNKVKESKEKYNAFIKLFNDITGKKNRGDKKSEPAFYARLKDGYTYKDFKQAISNAFNDSYHKENPQYLTPEFITRQDKLEKWINATPKKQGFQKSDFPKLPND